MTANPDVPTNEYLSSTRSVLRAGKKLQEALKAKASEEGNLKKKDSAIRLLEQAGRQHDLGAQSYRAFMFKEVQGQPTTELPVTPQSAKDLFASVLNDLQVASVYIAAGQNIGETPEPPKPALLTNALHRLEDTTIKIEQSLASSATEGKIPSSFGFVEGKVELPVVSSADAESAAATFETRSAETLKAVVDEAEGVVTLIIDYLKKLGPEKVLAALQSLGGPLAEVPALIGKLIKQGMEKMESAVNALIKLLGNDAVAKIKDEIVKLWNDVTGGGIVSYLLGKAFAVETTTEKIKNILKLKALNKDKLDQASNDLAQLLLPYKNDLAIAKKATQAISFSAAVLLVIPIAAPKVALLAAFAYGLVLSGVVLVGSDYADSGGILRRVRGVGEIANSLVPS
ncbi:MAG: hypothetical protein ABI923_05320 [bacterium]